ncbi:MAG: acyl carrier protein [Saccharothrix sp.]|nr:acyl carrier protein [Saccharothrix sp.]
MTAIEPAAGIAALDRLVAGDAAQVCVLPLTPAARRGITAELRVDELADLLRPRIDPGAPAGVAPRTVPEITRYLREVVATVTGAEPREIEAEAGFADLGVDSLAGLRMRELLVGGLGVALPATYLYHHSTIADLAEHLASASPGTQRGGDA